MNRSRCPHCGFRIAPLTQHAHESQLCLKEAPIIRGAKDMDARTLSALTQVADIARKDAMAGRITPDPGT